MSRPEAAKVGNDSRLYVSDYGNHRIQIFTLEGEYITSFGSEGGNDGQFRNVTGIALDKYNNIYACDLGNDRIQVFDSSGNFLYEWGTEGAGDGQFENLHGIIVDEDGYIYVADTGNNRIQRFRVLNFGS